MKYLTLIVASVVCAGLIGVCGADPATEPVALAAAEVHPAKNAATQPSWGTVTGTVTFTQQGDDVKVVADLAGLPPNTVHGFHIHAKGDLSAPDLSSAGGHYNPGHEHHGDPAGEHHHAGDMGNVTSDDKGDVHYEMVIKNLQVSAIVGKSVIVHAKSDDLKSDPSGNSGARIAGGVIEEKK